MKIKKVRDKIFWGYINRYFHGEDNYIFRKYIFFRDLEKAIKK